MAATAKFAAPKEFSFVPADWLAWKERYERYARATKLSEEADAQKIDALIYTMGEKADRIFKTLVFGTGESATNYTTVLAKFEAYFLPKRNIIYQRSLLWARAQSKTESVEEYYSDLHALCGRCEYPATLASEMLRDRLVLGLQDRDVQQKLFMHEGLTLAKALSVAQQYEMVKRQMESALAPSPPAQAFEVQKGVKSKRPETTTAEADICKQCGYKHRTQGRCPAAGKSCGKCGVTGHFRKMCKSAASANEIALEERDEARSTDGYFMGVVQMTAQPSVESTRGPSPRLEHRLGWMRSAQYSARTVPQRGMWRSRFAATQCVSRSIPGPTQR